MAPCDADDVWHPEKLERQVQALYEAPSDTGVAYCWTVGIDEHDAVIFPAWKRESHEGNVHEAMIIDSLPGCGSVPLILRKYFDAVGGYQSECGTNDDWRFYIALAAICKWVVVPAHLVGYRLRVDSASADYRLMGKTLAADTRWIVETWPGTRRELLRRRAHTVNSYLSFLALQKGDALSALRYRLAAIAARPSHLVSVEWLGFIYALVLRLFGIRRYYFPFWRRPSRCPRSEDGPTG